MSGNRIITPRNGGRVPNVVTRKEWRVLLDFLRERDEVLSAQIDRLNQQVADLTARLDAANIEPIVRPAADDAEPATAGPSPVVRSLITGDDTPGSVS